ncbi:Hypothetical predicted protein, partial [Paramuricea clavata]
TINDFLKTNKMAGRIGLWRENMMLTLRMCLKSSHEHFQVQYLISLRYHLQFLQRGPSSSISRRRTPLIRPVSMFTNQEYWAIITTLLFVPRYINRDLSLLKTVSTSSLESDLNSKTALTDRSRYSSNPLLLDDLPMTVLGYYLLLTFFSLIGALLQSQFESAIKRSPINEAMVTDTQMQHPRINNIFWLNTISRSRIKILELSYMWRSQPDNLVPVFCTKNVGQLLILHVKLQICFALLSLYYQNICLVTMRINQKMHLIVLQWLFLTCLQQLKCPRNTEVTVPLVFINFALFLGSLSLYTHAWILYADFSMLIHSLVSARLARGSVRGTLNNAAQASCIAKVLSASQKYMRKQENECSFVSLRDVERAMKVIIWFYSNSELINWVIGDGDNVRDQDNKSSEESSEDESDENGDEQVEQPLSPTVRAVILGIGVCYYARLNERETYCHYISRYFDNSCPLPGAGRTDLAAVIVCQRGFLKDIQLGRNIARNTALSENVFMMAICTELRIPLFVVGKPGSSKSLAKDVISTNMKAGNSQSELFKNLKQIHMQSYQCSPLSTPEGIVSTFSQCAKLQKDKDLKKFVSVVVLDEIGLAEDSPLMPLKTLHPLLEDGTATTEESGKTSDHHRVGFIGLSNWALDPAKMNRGIMLSRGVPSENELRDSASKCPITSSITWSKKTRLTT